MSPFVNTTLSDRTNDEPVRGQVLGVGYNNAQLL